MAVWITLSLSESNVDIQDNQSKVTADLVCHWDSGSWNAMSPPGYITIAGTKYNFNSSFNTGQTASGSSTIATKSKTITHNSDGSKTVSVQASFSTGVSSGTVTTSKSITLTTIPRATVPTVSPTSVTLGNQVTISMPRKSSSFTHTLTYSIGNASGTIGSNLGTSTTWTPPTTLASQLPAATSGKVKITCKTYNGGTVIGTKSVNLTVTVPAGIVPVINSVGSSETVAAVTAAFGNRYVRTLSKLLIDIDAEGASGSTISAYKAVLDGVTYNKASFTSNAINHAGNMDVDVTVTDTRGRTATWAHPITVYDYDLPVVNSIEYYQCDQNGVQDNNGTYTKVTIKGKAYDVDNQNTKTLTLKYKSTQDANYTEITVPTNAWDFTAEQLISGTDPSLTYEFIARLTDKISYSEMKVITGVICISRRAGGKGVTLFAEAEGDGFKVADNQPSVFTGSVTIQGAEIKASLGDSLNWSSGDLTVTGISNYTMVLVRLDGEGTRIPCVIAGGYLRGGTAWVNSAGNIITYSVSASIVGDKLTYVNSGYMRHNASGDHGAWTQVAVDAITGLI